MGDDKSSSPMVSRERDRELLIPVGAGGGDPTDDSDHKPSSSSASFSHHQSGREVSTKAYRLFGSICSGLITWEFGNLLFFCKEKRGLFGQRLHLMLWILIGKSLAF